LRERGRQLPMRVKPGFSCVVLPQIVNFHLHCGMLFASWASTRTGPYFSMAPFPSMLPCILAYHRTRIPSNSHHRHNRYQIVATSSMDSGFSQGPNPHIGQCVICKLGSSPQRSQVGTQRKVYNARKAHEGQQTTLRSPGQPFSIGSEVRHNVREKPDHTVHPDGIASPFGVTRQLMVSESETQFKWKIRIRLAATSRHETGNE
jgi:hypothetical protein